DGRRVARPGGVRAACRRGGCRGGTPAEPRRPSCAGRVRGAGLDHRPGSGSGGGTGTMIDPRTRRPEEGWLTLALVVLMIAVVASAVDDPAWVNGRGYLTDGLVWLGLLGVAVGFIGPKVGWGRWTTHGVGALFAGLLIPIVAGWAEYPGLSIGQTFGHTAYGTIQAYLDIAWRQYAFTSQEVHFVVVLGIIMWGTGQ